MSETGQVPDSVTHREIQEVLRTFAGSRWTGMTLEVEGMRITVGKNGPPATAPAQAPPAAPAAAPPLTPPPLAAAPPAPAPPTAAPVAPPPAAGPVDTSGCVAVRSPAVGSFWVAPSPGQPPFVHVGQTVAADEQLAIVEVMKLMNPVLAPGPGEVVQVCAADADLVEYEQVLFWIRPADG